MKKNKSIWGKVAVGCVALTVSLGLSACGGEPATEPLPELTPVPAIHQHQLTKTEGTKATCLQDGTKSYWYCAGCKDYFADAQGENKIDNFTDWVIIQHSGHDYQEKDHRCGNCHEFDVTILPNETQFAVVQADGNYATVTTFKEALNTAKDGAEVILFTDATVNENFVIQQKIILNLNGKTITNGIAGVKGNYGAFQIIGNGNLTVKGNGSIITTAENYVFSLNGNGQITIEDGTYSAADCTILQVDQAAIANINGGDFAITNTTWGYTYVLNFIDKAYQDKTAQINVRGGTFKNYDPAHSAGDQPTANFVADNYQVISNVQDKDTYYTVIPQAN